TPPWVSRRGPKPDGTLRGASGSAAGAPRRVPPLLDRARIVGSETFPSGGASDVSDRPLTTRRPGEVSMIESGPYIPASIAAASANGLKLEPGSKMSVTARFL